jgi:hypothetical protein
MQLYEILPEQDLSIEKITDQASADRFLSRMDKKSAKVSQPAVAKKVEELEARIEEVEDKDPKDSRIKDLQAAVSRLKQWQKDNPLIKVTNPAKHAVGGPGNLFGTGKYGDRSTAF